MIQAFWLISVDLFPCELLRARNVLEVSELAGVVNVTHKNLLMLMTMTMMGRWVFI